jgi:histidyl-tRNA synthetase
VVLALVMKDKGLMPDEAGLLERAGMRPDVFVISNGTPGAEPQVRPLVAALRRAGLHARHTYKTTRNVGKLLKEASDQRAHVAVIIENETTCAIKTLATGAQHQAPIAEAVGHVRLARLATAAGVC